MDSCTLSLLAPPLAPAPALLALLAPEDEELPQAVRGRRDTTPGASAVQRVAAVRVMGLRAPRCCRFRAYPLKPTYLVKFVKAVFLLPWSDSCDSGCRSGEVG